MRFTKKKDRKLIRTWIFITVVLFFDKINFILPRNLCYKINDSLLAIKLLIITLRYLL